MKLIANLARPANLPFGLIMWAKRYILQYQCHYHYTHNTTHHLLRSRRYIEPTCPELFKEYSNPQNSTQILLSTLLGTTHDAQEVKKLDQIYHKESLRQNVSQFSSPTSLLTHVYYTESDQLLFFESLSLRNIVLQSSNMSVHIVGRRREKLGDTNPNEPFDNLQSTRHLCGNASDPYILDTDVDYYFRRKFHD